MFAQPPMPRTAMEQSGHAQVPTLLVALVRRQAGRAGGQQKSAAKTENNKSLRKKDGTYLNDSHSKTSEKIIDIFIVDNTACL